MTPKLGMASILCWNFIKKNRKYSERLDRNTLITFDPLRVLEFLYNEVPTLSFGVSMIASVDFSKNFRPLITKQRNLKQSTPSLDRLISNPYGEFRTS